MTMDNAGETRSDARVASEGPRATMKKTPSLHVGRGPVPRHRPCNPTRAGACPPHYEKKRLLGPTDLKRHRLTMDDAGETRSDARMETSEGPALREHRD